jgi:hypothetical protein
MPGKVSIERAESISELQPDWSLQLDAMPHSPLQSAGSTGEVSFNAPTTPQTPLVMYNRAVFSYFFPINPSEIKIAATVPLPPPTPGGTGTGTGWGEGTWGGNTWGGLGGTTGGGPGGGTTTGSGWGTEAWGTDPWGA